MQIGVRHRFVYVANPAPGGEALEAQLMLHAEINRLGAPRRRALPWSGILREYAFLFEQASHAPERYFKFGLLHEPLAWVQALQIGRAHV